MSTQEFGGPWTDQKLKILRQYLDAYTTALKNQQFRLTYVDAFAGSGSYEFTSGEYDEFRELRRGSTRIALEIDDKPFDRFLFVESDPERVASLRALADEHAGRSICIVQGDANSEIPRFCDGMAWNDRAVVFLDPYKIEVSWTTIEAIAVTEKIDCWILFPLMAVARMMPTGNEPDEATSKQLDRIFGGRGYWEESYRDSHQLSFLEDEPRRERARGSKLIAERYKRRLSTVFYSVAESSRMLTNSNNAPLFELMFAAGNPVGARRAIPIADHILKKW